MDDVFDVNILKKRIINVDKERFCLGSHNKLTKHKKHNIPDVWFKDLKKLCKMYGCKFVIYNSKFSNEFSGMYYPHSKKVVICSSDITGIDVVKTFTHELGHALQHTSLSVDETDVIFNSYDKMLKYERAAERVAYYIAKAHFPHLLAEYNLCHRSFSAYRSESDKQFMKVSMGV